LEDQRRRPEELDKARGGLADDAERGKPQQGEQQPAGKAIAIVIAVRMTVNFGAFDERQRAPLFFSYFCSVCPRRPTSRASRCRPHDAPRARAGGRFRSMMRAVG